MRTDSTRRRCALAMSDAGLDVPEDVDVVPAVVVPVVEVVPVVVAVVPRGELALDDIPSST